MRRILAPCPVKITVTSTAPHITQAGLAGATVPQNIVVQLPDLQARCQSAPFFCLLDVFNTVILEPRPPMVDLLEPAGMLFSEIMPDDHLDLANTWLMRARVLQEQCMVLNDELVLLYGSETEVRRVIVVFAYARSPSLTYLTLCVVIT